MRTSHPHKDAKKQIAGQKRNKTSQHRTLQKYNLPLPLSPPLYPLNGKKLLLFFGGAAFWLSMLDKMSSNVLLPVLPVVACVLVVACEPCRSGRRSSPRRGPDSALRPAR